RRLELGSSISSSLQLYSNSYERSTNLSRFKHETIQNLLEFTLQDVVKTEPYQQENQLIYRARAKAGNQGTKNRCDKEAGRQREQVKTIHRLKHNEGLINTETKL
ncbi:hypothetical protein GOODEAATRI_027183, partial [Goodea atripinnis]